MRHRALLLALSLAFAPFPAAAQTDPTLSAQAAMEELQAAGEALEAADGARDRVAALTQTVQAYEKGLAALREGLRQATMRESAIHGVFSAESERLAQLLGVLQSIEAAPESHLLLHPSGPLGTARSGMILSDVTPALSREAMALREALQEVAMLRALQEAAVSTLEEGLQGVQAARIELSKAVANRTDLPRRLVADEEAMENLINSADTLESFASGLMSATVEETGVSIAQPDFSEAQGVLDMPVLGRVIRRFEEADAAGVKRPGWVVATRPLTLVTTPWPATIRYLGPLLDYGEVAILEPGEGYFLVLAGLGQLFGTVGEVLPKGAPVGLMGGAQRDEDQAFLITSAQGGGAQATESLYIEIRRDGTPQDPGTWFAGPEN
ncbi:murein hydrolase activator EnvC [Maritimibacter sp. HL-12]|uniref:murein hydrolase activator EnvC family protein n=1 Tax=Maritimibacter sp. HL-12 TaxID=1162418 RepID=UPI000A1CD252|nr:peptidase M23 [Maritimibacter sp. HL-12]